MFLFSKEEYISEKNGKIIVDKFFDATNILVNGVIQSGVFVLRMWNDVFKRLPKTYEAKSILVLGLAGGNIIDILQKRYKNAKITIVEWDEVMIDIAKKVKLFSITDNIKIINRDAFELLPKMEEKFDIVVVDLFTGDVLPNQIIEKNNIEYIKNLLKKDGYMFINFFRHEKYLNNFKESFFLKESWKYNENTLAFFNHIDNPNNEKHLPDNFIHLKQSLNFLKGSFGEKNRKIVGADGAIGVRYTFGLFAVEYYTGDKEPELESFKGFRLVIWDRIMNDKKPQKWHQTIPGFGLATCVIVDVSPEEYWKDWTKTLRQYRAKWETQTEYEILKTNRDKFVEYYNKFAKPQNTIDTCVGILDKHLKASGDNFNLFILKNKLSGDVVGGIGTVDAPEVNQSYYLIAFSDKEKAPPSTGLWLLNNWFLHCKNLNIPLANLGVIYTFGQPRDWKGFTEFKSHFRPITLRYKRPLFKVTFS